MKLKSGIFKKDQMVKIAKSEIRILRIEEEMKNTEEMTSGPQDRSYKHREKNI